MKFIKPKIKLKENINQVTEKMAGRIGYDDGHYLNDTVCQDKTMGLETPIGYVTSQNGKEWTISIVIKPVV